MLLSKALARKLLAFYNYPHPQKPGSIILGYDGPHALRTTRMCVAVARRLGYSEATIYNYEIACLLHDLGRAGLDQKLFGAIWSWARRQGIPTRPREWRRVHPRTRYGRETEAFLEEHRHELVKLGIPIDEWTCEQVEMRLGYARRLARQLRVVKPKLAALGVRWIPWMQRVMLYYYYPEKLSRAPAWLHELAEVLVACEQFEAYSNRRRGQDYYTRHKERLPEAFAYLDKLRVEKILSQRVLNAVRALAAEGAFDGILHEARGKALSTAELQYLRSLAPVSLKARVAAKGAKDLR
jgi:hypothetical protein